MRFVISPNPPGINETYKIGKNKKTDKRFFYKSEVATAWAADAALQIGAQAGLQNWEDISDYYQISIIFTNFNLDVDAPLKLCLDVLSQKLGFNDNRIMKASIEKIISIKDEIIIDLEPY